MFELGARPHPPRDLYRAYLEQSDVFVGLYGERYGWIAPGEEISGLEDEYRLAPPQMPKLVYIKEGSDQEERLEALLDRIRDDDGTSYAYFTDIDELAELIRADLATLLAERFAVGAGAPVPAGGRRRRPSRCRPRSPRSSAAIGSSSRSSACSRATPG